MPLAHDPAPDETLFEMANLRPRTTGLPMVIWVSERGRARHGARIKVARSHGDRIDPYETLTVTLEEPEPRVIGGALPATDYEAVRSFIAGNRETLVAYWNGEIDTAELIARLEPLAPR